MKKALILGSFIILTAISCSKDDDNPVNPPSGTTYMSLSVGSTRNFEFIDVATADTTPYTITSTNRDTMINSKSYHIFSNSTGGAEYYNITGSNYYTFQSLPDAVGGNSVENLYLKDNAAVNATWTEINTVVVSGIPVTVTSINKIISKGGTRVVNGITYTDVIDVDTDISASSPLGPITGLTTDIHTYYAPRVGQIENTSIINLDFMGIIQNTNNKTILKSAIIL